MISYCIVCWPFHLMGDFKIIGTVIIRARTYGDIVLILLRSQIWLLKPIGLKVLNSFGKCFPLPLCVRLHDHLITCCFLITPCLIRVNTWRLICAWHCHLSAPGSWVWSSPCMCGFPLGSLVSVDWLLCRNCHELGMCVHGVVWWIGITFRMYSHFQCSWNSLWIHHNPDNDELATKDEWMNIYTQRKQEILETVHVYHVEF